MKTFGEKEAWAYPAFKLISNSEQVLVLSYSSFWLIPIGYFILYCSYSHMFMMFIVCPVHCIAALDRI